MRLQAHLLSIAVVAAAGPALAATPAVPPPPPAQEPAPIEDSSPARSIFTYRLDGRCQVERTRKLQGPRGVRWRDADETLGMVREEVVFRYVDGERLQLRERRIKLLGEMVRDRLLVCRVRPSGEVVEAWIERHDDGATRRQSVRRESLPVRDGRIPDLGTYSLSFHS